MRKLVVSLPLLVVCLVAAACGTAKSGATAPSSAVGSNPCAVKNLALLTPGTLTIGTDNPAYSPYFTGGPGHSWTGKYNNDPYTGKGFEAAVAYAVAKQMGFSNAAGEVAGDALQPVLRAGAEGLRLLPRPGLAARRSAPRRSTSRAPTTT